MQLGANKVPTSTSLSDWAMEAAAEAESEDTTQSSSNPWGNDDLIDVNADQDDWSAFESAPVPAAVVDLSFDGDAPPGAFSPSDDWGFSSPAPTQLTIPIHQPKPTSAVKVPAAASTRSPPPTSRISTFSPNARSPTPSERTASPAPEKVQTQSTAGMTKEEKAAEMARRKEERKQRIAALKQQKKHTGAAKT
ncbi:hypothetical protein EVJ58_g5312 [Rhodofomes roseus]|uniref:Uncharacterized protein n=1 Tax=Rhodofomes roseus TaxID=34475 RepID=A0A4Y9YF40_9APHY|nr:hypothetical protein EVJ58_g5312 [Rhodofomes roseus]